MPLGNLASRLLTAGVAVPVLIAAILWREPIGVGVLVIGASTIGMREWVGMTMPGVPPADRRFGVALGLSFAVALYAESGRPAALPVIVAALVLITFLYFLARPATIDTVAARLAFTLAGLFYVVFLLAFLGQIKRRPDGAAWIFVALTIAWLSDTGAYFAGRFLGSRWPRKLYPLVSPKKTVVGLLGGIAASVGAVALAKVWYLPSLAWSDCLLLGVPANLLGQAGDLCESLVKRAVAVKDSGALLPGHGGMLDRIDALLFVCPYVYWYAGLR